MFCRVQTLWHQHCVVCVHTQQKQPSDIIVYKMRLIMIAHTVINAMQMAIGNDDDGYDDGVR